MEERNVSPPKFLSIMWLVLGLSICISNIFTSYMLWLSKISREKSELGRKIHGLWNVICINLAFSLVGLSLFVSMALLLARNAGLSDPSCDLFGFLHSFGFNFAVIGILIGLVEKAYQFFKPFEYHAYIKGKSNIPLVVFGCCMVYSLFLAIIPLTRLGKYHQLKYATCVVSWDGDTATWVTAIFSLTLFSVNVAFIVLDLWLSLKVYANRKRMNVSLLRPRETSVFTLVTSSLFLICWFPYLIAMLISVSALNEPAGEAGIAVMFGVTLVPFFVSPVINYVLNGRYQEECKKFCGSVDNFFMSKITSSET